MAIAADEEAILATVSDYIEGWLDGDASRMERALHPELMKRCRGIEGDDPDALETLTAREMIDATAEGRERDLPLPPLHRPAPPNPHAEGWRIVNAAWRLR